VRAVVSGDQLGFSVVTAADELPVLLLQRLVQLDSSNPPGNERACVELIASTVRAAGVEPRILGSDPARPNLVARIGGRGVAPPLLLYGHTDVVPAKPGEWRHPPFGGELIDGEVWGRGALDMKGGLAMLLTAFLRVAQKATPPPGDVIFAATSDEEAGGEAGAAFLVRHHGELFADVRHALSEYGGYTEHVAGRRLVPIGVAEKRRCTLRVTVAGRGGHSAIPRHGQVPGKLGLVLVALDRRRTPTHVTPAVSEMIRAVADGLPAPLGGALRALLRPRLTDTILRLAGGRGEDLDPLFRNTATPTIIRAGETLNVVPAVAHAELDGRLLPGHDPEMLSAELGAIVPAGTRLEVLGADPPPARPQPNLELLPLLGRVLREDDPACHPFPLVNAGMTDARHFDRLGIQTYGFLPMRLPPGLMPQLLHAPNERIPAAALTAGARAIARVIERYRPI
jgi:acetylornithine deacetylase/succinyl-diaminopimelate desuccinylase-like protein